MRRIGPDIVDTLSQTRRTWHTVVAEDRSRAARAFANILSWSRILSAPVAFVCLLESGEGSVYLNIARLVVALAWLTDAADGALIRYYRCEQTKSGQLLDPIADKIFFGLSFIAVTIAWDFPLWMTASLLLREIVLVVTWILFILGGREVAIRPNWWGKSMVFFQTLTILFVLFSSADLFVRIAGTVTIVSALVSGGLYIYENWDGFVWLARRRQDAGV
ncbi:MAG: CDP-alcohol phosphatidyltransferase family protein [Candidatus Methylomirabilales bacterium]